MKVQQFVAICMPHTEAHLQMMGMDQFHKKELDAFRARIGAIKNNMQQINAVVQQGQEHFTALQQAQQSAQTKDQIKMAEAQSQIAIDRAMAASKIRNQQLKTMSQVQTAQQKTAAHVQSQGAMMRSQVAQSNEAVSPLGAGVNEPETGTEGFEDIPYS
jgi:hypothetical protein